MIFSTFLQPSPSPPLSIFNVLKTSPNSPLLLSYSHTKSHTTTAAAWKRIGGVPAAAAARDRVIDFGKYKGRMLGSLPSSYLKWVTKNLRAGDTEEWAKLADEVLADPVYRDRIEWEMAEKVLSGGNNESSRRNPNGNAVSELLEISERFGWDNEDKEGWSRIDFGLLGTSKGGRIPRMKEISYSGYCKKEEENNRNNIDGKKLRMVEEEGGGRRRERRERMRSRRRTSVGNGGWTTEEDEDVVNTTSSRSSTRTTMTIIGSGESGSRRRNPFPGRDALLNKVRRQRDM